MRSVPFGAAAAALLIAILLPARTFAQALPADPAEGARMQIGPFSFRPTFDVNNVGVDSNVFNDAQNPRDDFSATISPALQVIVRGGPARVTYNARLDYVWFQTYSSERSVNSSTDGRFELRFTRLVPFVSGGLAETRDRASQEIDLRAQRRDTSIMAGSALILSPTTAAVFAFRHHGTNFASDQIYDGVSLEQELDGTLRAMDAELRVDLTPLTTFSLRGSWEQQEFHHSPDRDSRSLVVRPALEFNPSALISGQLMVGYRAFDPVDPLLPAFNGVIAQADLAYVLGAATRLEGRLTRDVQYSFEPEYPFYIVLGGQVTVTQQIAGPWDVQARAGRQRHNYQGRGVSTAPALTVDTFGGGVGFRFGDRSRLGLTLETTRRRGDERLTANDYDRNRVFGSFSYGF